MAVIGGVLVIERIMSSERSCIGIKGLSSNELFMFYLAYKRQEEKKKKSKCMI